MRDFFAVPYIWKLLTFVYDSIWRRVGLRGAGPERSRPLPLSREEIALIVLAYAEGKSFTPVQIQKSLFLADEKVRDAFSQNSRYDFQPYDYGPFDWQVYSDVEDLERIGLAKINQQPGSRWRTYAATENGVAEGRRLAERLTGAQRDVLLRIVDLVRKLSFNELVSAIYKAYPPMVRDRASTAACSGAIASG
jgi:uncharacterized protein